MTASGRWVYTILQPILGNAPGALCRGDERKQETRHRPPINHMLQLSDAFGQWRTKTLQNTTGKIHAVHIDTSPLPANRDVDEMQNSKAKYRTLISYAPLSPSPSPQAQYPHGQSPHPAQAHGPGSASLVTSRVLNVNWTSCLFPPTLLLRR
ncbi:hypothetical protein K505DRAFT_164031 [Melanomma pulvis-pyrius CBS 109.77]|uniref:Uncharacterized protein n=1 Tax=Melanomma pulvis-pyrius CBS 109.77 TaxID=1314802 RepID=A0A6A6WP84_9PLEO|nr:hypothetical protein K505DRAFT_164031 [Melanomma pulvis-pyrius CBS 109.77]